MGFGRAVAAMTRSTPSSTSPGVRIPGDGGCWTRTWRRRSTASTTTTCSANWGLFPARGLIAEWLTAGVVEKGRLTPTEEGTPQGGVVSPLLLNVALHGMEQAAGVRYLTVGAHAVQTEPSSPVLIRYADDLVSRVVSLLAVG